jgi:hypothetical protein
LQFDYIFLDFGFLLVVGGAFQFGGLELLFELADEGAFGADLQLELFDVFEQLLELPDLVLVGFGQFLQLLLEEGGLFDHLLELLLGLQELLVFGLLLGFKE